MFSTLRSSTGEETLQPIEQNSRGRLACSTCRQKKLRCSGGKPACQRCHDQGVGKCSYVHDRRRLRARVGHPQRHEAGDRVATATTSCTAVTQDTATCTASVDSLEQSKADISLNAMRTSISDLAASSWENPMMCDYNTSIGHVGSLDMLFPPFNDSDDIGSGLSAQDLFRITPPADVASSATQEDPGHVAFTCPNAARIRPNLPVCNNDCFHSALRNLEVLDSIPDDGPSTPRDLLKHVSIYKRCCQAISKHLRCAQCAQNTQFLLLLVATLDTYVDAFEGMGHILTPQNLLIMDSALTDYGVDSADDFIRMYRPILLPIRDELKRIVQELLIRFKDETSRSHQFLIRTAERLEMLDID